MKRQRQTRSVEQLFPFVLRSRILIVGRRTLARSKSRLQFVLITDDLSETSRNEVLSDYEHYPVLQHYTAEDLSRFFRIKGAKVIGFAKSGLAQSLYAELKEYRINTVLTVSQIPEAPKSRHGSSSRLPIADGVAISPKVSATKSLRKHDIVT
jgi:hypothetical protein